LVVRRARDPARGGRARPRRRGGPDRRRCARRRGTERSVMFTGLVEELGRVETVEEDAAGRRLWITAARVLQDAPVGDSLSCSGCCLTVVAVEPGRFAFEAVPETLRLTTLGAWRAGTPVNLERSLRLSDRLGGHLVQGHVDGVGEVRAREAVGEGA